MQPAHDYLRHLTRRTFIGRAARGIGGVALGSLLDRKSTRLNSSH